MDSIDSSLNLLTHLSTSVIGDVYVTLPDNGRPEDAVLPSEGSHTEADHRATEESNPRKMVYMPPELVHRILEVLEYRSYLTLVSRNFRNFAFRTISLNHVALLACSKHFKTLRLYARIGQILLVACTRRPNRHGSKADDFDGEQLVRKDSNSRRSGFHQTPTIHL